MSASKSFESIFHERLDEIESRAKKQGLTITHVCRESGVSRATPDRWRLATPLSVSLLDKMLQVVEKAENN